MITVSDLIVQRKQREKDGAKKMQELFIYVERIISQLK
jgi:hypothetical protein